MHSTANLSRNSKSCYNTESQKLLDKLKAGGSIIEEMSSVQSNYRGNQKMVNIEKLDSLDMESDAGRNQNQNQAMSQDTIKIKAPPSGVPSRFQEYYNQKKHEDSGSNQRKLTSLIQYLRDKDVSGSTEARINSSSLEASTNKRGEPRHEYRSSATTLEAGSGISLTTDLTRIRRSVCDVSQKSNLP